MTHEERIALYNQLNDLYEANTKKRETEECDYERMFNLGVGDGLLKAINLILDFGKEKEND